MVASMALQQEGLRRVGWFDASRYSLWMYVTGGDRNCFNRFGCVRILSKKYQSVSTMTLNNEVIDVFPNTVECYKAKPDFERFLRDGIVILEVLGSFLKVTSSGTRLCR